MSSSDGAPEASPPAAPTASFTGGFGGADGPSGPRVWVVNAASAGIVRWCLRYLVFFGLAALWLSLLAGGGLYRYFAADLPPLEHIERYQTSAPGITRIVSQEGVLLAELAREHRAYARYEEVPEDLVHAFLAAEDRRFFTHGGLDVRGLGRALLANVRSGTVSQGGSTITQQVAKGFLSQEQTLSRKLREAILSVRMESRLEKTQILEIYLNKIFLGHAAYGVAAAASRYFGKDLRDLTLAESALIAGLARAPSRYSPVSHPEAAKTRRAVVLQDMVEAGYITPSERDAADAEPISLSTPVDVFRDRAPYYAEHVRRTLSEELGGDAILSDGLRIESALELPLQRMAEDTVDRALRRIDHKHGWRGPVAHLLGESEQARFDQRLIAEYGPDPLADPKRPWRLAVVRSVERSGAVVDLGAIEVRLPVREMNWAAPYDHNSGINAQTTQDARKALEVGDVVWVRRSAPVDPADPSPPLVELGQTPRVEAALYTLEHDTGYVVAMQGGHDYDRSQFNRTVQACRQPGSVFKAIYYALALDTGDYTMASVLEDRPYEPEPGEVWNPQNIHGTLEGEVLLRNAFIHSLNLPSIRLFVRLGANRVVTWARRLGFSTELIADRALSLGASCVHIDELTRAFGIFAEHGRSIEPTVIRRIIDKRGVVRVDRRHFTDGAMDIRGRLDALGREALQPPTQVIDRRTAYLTTQMLSDVVTSGIGRRATKIGVAAGGKSGTASKNAFTTDTWFVGFTSRYVTSAWMGDDEYERSLGDEEASYTTATPMWTDYMTKVVDGVPHGDVPTERSPGVHSRTVEFQSGGQTRQATLYFRDDHP